MNKIKLLGILALSSVVLGACSLLPNHSKGLLKQLSKLKLLVRQKQLKRR